MSTTHPYAVTRIAVLPGLAAISIDQTNNLLYATTGNAIYKLNL